MMNTIQNFLFSFQGVKPRSEELFIRRGPSVFVDEGGCLTFSSVGGEVDFQTYFNLFNVSLWKKCATIDELSLQIEGAGDFVLEFFNIVTSSGGFLVQSVEVCYVSLSENSKKLLPVRCWSSLAKGQLGVKIRSKGKGKVSSISYVTKSMPENADSKFGVVMTHFNRISEAVPAINNLQAEFDGNRYSEDEDISFFIIDNSQNLPRDLVHEAVQVINNENYGGSGGFTRGLIELVNSNFTHCLFMDDDASCEPESVRRTFALMRYAKKSNLAISGALLRSEEDFRLFEKGALFDGMCKPLKSGLDMRHLGDLAAAENSLDKPSYGGWWFFCFPISAVTYFPFPFFVRGDDVMFGLQNDFEIVTSNGIASWGDDFEVKTGPLPIYLDARNHLMQAFSNDSITPLNSLIAICKMYINCLFSHNYASARAISEAISDVANGGGKQFWVDNIDTKHIRDRIKGYNDEIMKPIDIREVDVDFGCPFESRKRKLLRLLTLNGMFLPEVLYKKAVIVQHKSFRANFREIFRYKKILHWYELKEMGYISVVSKKRFFMELFRFIRAFFGLCFKYKKVSRFQSGAIEHLTKKSFWDSLYK